MAERRLEESFLDRLVHDLETQLDEFEEARREVGSVMAHGLTVLPQVRGEVEVISPMGMISSAYQASRYNATIELVDHTYVELLSTGGLGVITSPEIRTAVVEFYRRYAFGRPEELRAAHNAGYYNAVRGRIPVEIQREIRETMILTETKGCAMEDAPLQCRLGVADPMVGAVAESLTTPEVAQSLNLWMQSLVNELGLTESYAEIVRDVLATIEENR
jgi:hypothetical protein